MRNKYIAKTFKTDRMSRWLLKRDSAKSKFHPHQSTLSHYWPVADLGGAPLRPKIFLISCSFSENLTKSYVGAPPGGRRPLLQGILDPPLLTAWNKTVFAGQYCKAFTCIGLVSLHLSNLCWVGIFKTFTCAGLVRFAAFLTNEHFGRLTDSYVRENVFLHQPHRSTKMGKITGQLQGSKNSVVNRVTRIQWWTGWQVFSAKQAAKNSVVNRVARIQWWIGWQEFSGEQGGKYSVLNRLPRIQWWTGWQEISGEQGIKNSVVNMTTRIQWWTGWQEFSGEQGGKNSVVNRVARIQC